MTGDRLKHDVSSDVGRSDGTCRSGATRRRLAKPTSLRENGSLKFENDLALALKESLKYAKQMDSEPKPMEDSSIRRNNIENQKNELETKSSISSRMDTLGEMQLKELLVLHIDLIQHQQELVIQKDRQIKQIKQERDNLKCRLDRMERRMSLLKHRIPDVELSENPTRQKGDHHPSTQCLSENLPSHTTEKSLKRKRASFEPQNLGKRFVTDLSVESRNKPTDTKLQPKVDRTNRSRSRTFTIPTEEIYNAWGYRARPGQIAADPSMLKELQKRTSIKKTDNVDNSVLRTKDNYHISFYQPVAEHIEIENKPDLLKGAQSQLTVEVPHWRIKMYTNQWGLEGTENMEDEIYTKRHTKPEIEEKRRKRWDLQRSREQAAYEKLREKEKGADVPIEENSNSVESFYPSLDNITHLEITDKIPVMVFGHGIPKMDATGFKLPWDVNMKKGHSHLRTRHTRNT